MENHFRRIEKKYFIRKDEEKEFIHLLKKHLGLKGNPYDKEYTHIRSIYFDSDQLRCYRDHFTLDNRHKVRIRNYSPDGDDLDFSFIELKKKNGSITEKERFKYARVTRKELVSYFDPFVAEDYNSRNEGLFKSVQDVNTMIAGENLHPMCWVSYDRISLENSAIRVTLDSNIESRMLAVPNVQAAVEIRGSEFWNYTDLLMRYFDAGAFIIVEVKDEFPTEDHLPEPIKLFLQGKRENFSKYCYSITKYLKGKSL